MTKRLLTILMPALNEEDGIGQVIEDLPNREIKNMGFDVEVLVIDGGSRDKTVEIAKSKGAKVIIWQRGYGKQYKKGLKEARGEIIVTGDSDGSYPFEKIPYFVKILEAGGLDFINVNRFAKMEKGSMHFSNHIGNFILTFFTNLLFSNKIKDSQSGMWIIRKKALGKMILTSDGMPFSEEIKVEAFSKVKSLEVDGYYKKRLGKTKLSKIKDGVKNIVFLFKKRLCMIHR